MGDDGTFDAQGGSNGVLAKGGTQTNLGRPSFNASLKSGKSALKSVSERIALSAKKFGERNSLNSTRAHTEIGTEIFQ